MAMDIGQEVLYQKIQRVNRMEKSIVLLKETKDRVETRTHKVTSVRSTDINCFFFLSILYD